jgi:hypothetical protein
MRQPSLYSPPWEVDETAIFVLTAVRTLDPSCYLVPLRSKNSLSATCSQRPGVYVLPLIERSSFKPIQNNKVIFSQNSGRQWYLPTESWPAGQYSGTNVHSNWDQFSRTGWSSTRVQRLPLSVSNETDRLLLLRWGQTTPLWNWAL